MGKFAGLDEASLSRADGRGRLPWGFWIAKRSQIETSKPSGEIWGGLLQKPEAKRN